MRKTFTLILISIMICGLFIDILLVETVVASDDAHNELVIETFS